MIKNNLSDNKWIGTSIVAAIAASLCCIAPVLAVLGGVGGIATTFSFLEPLRPYLIGITIAVLGFAFYEAYKPNKKSDIDCACDDTENPSKKNFLNSKTFLWLVTGLSILMFAFPSYSHIFFPDTNENVVVVDENNISETELYIEGMTCTGCEESVNYALKTEEGVISATSSFETGIAKVKYDKSKITSGELSKVIEEKVGYTVKSFEIVKDK